MVNKAVRLASYPSFNVQIKRNGRWRLWKVAWINLNETQSGRVILGIHFGTGEGAVRHTLNIRYLNYVLRTFQLYKDIEAPRKKGRKLEMVGLLKRIKDKEKLNKKYGKKTNTGKRFIKVYY